MDLDKRKVSVFAPIGAAVLGARTGDIVEWDFLQCKRRLKIEKVLHRTKKQGH